MEHTLIPPGEMHPVHNWEVASEAALDTLSVTYADVGKLALVQGTGYFRLTSASPMLWVAVDDVPVGLSYASSTLTLTLKSGNVVAMTLTPTTLGLGNVDNTSDANKPVSTAQAAADAAVLTAAQSYADSAASAAASSAQSYAVQRANHTGTQTASTISDFNSVAAAAAPVQSVNGATGNVTVNAATGASYVANTGVLTVAKNNSQASDTLTLNARDWVVLAAGNSQAVNSGMKILARPSNTASCQLTLPNASDGYTFDLRIKSTSSAAGSVVCTPYGTQTIAGGSAGAAVTYAGDGIYQFRYYNSTWEVTVTSDMAARGWVRCLDTATTAVIGGKYEVVGGTLTLPAAGMQDGDTVTVRAYLTDGTSTHNNNNDPCTIQSASTRYIRAVGDSSGTATSVPLSTMYGDARYKVQIDIVWHASLGCWYYTPRWDGVLTYIPQASFSLTSGVNALAFNVSAIAALTTRTLTMPDNDVDLGRLATLPRYNTSSSNTAPAGTDAAIVAGSSNVAAQDRQCVVSHSGFAGGSLPKGAVICGNGNTSVAAVKNTVAEMTLKAKVVFASGVVSVFPTEEGYSSSSGTLGRHVPACSSTRTVSVQTVGVHTFTFFCITDEATPKLYSGVRRVTCRYDGSTYSIVATETIGTDQNPDGMTGVSVNFTLSSGFLIFNFQGAGTNGNYACLHVSVKSLYNGG